MYFLKVKFVLPDFIMCTSGRDFILFCTSSWHVYLVNQNCVLRDATMCTSKINLVYFVESPCVLPIFQMILLFYPHFIEIVHFWNWIFVLRVVLMCTSLWMFSCRWFSYFSALPRGMCISKNDIAYFPHTSKIDVYFAKWLCVLL